MKRKKRKTGQAADFTPDWELLPHMKFLKDFIRHQCTAGNMETSASIEDDDKEDIGMTCSTQITDGCGLVQDSSPNPPVAISEDHRSLPVSPSTLSSPVSTALHNHYHINK